MANSHHSSAPKPTSYVAVSKQMHWLRHEQNELNYFLWSTELTYGLVLSANDKRLSEPNSLASDALRNIQSEAWYPNTAGNHKYNARISSYLEQLPKNQPLAAQATAMMWYSRFESYLTKRLGHISHRKSWGTFTRHLNLPELLNAKVPVRAKSVLRADLCRHLRNLMTHEPHLPDSLNHPLVGSWMDVCAKEASSGNPLCASASDVKQAAADVVGQAINSLKTEQAQHKELSLVFFYTLFSFTNFDSLAFEIEEALQPLEAEPVATIRRQTDKIRRKDLIVPQPVPEP